MRTNRGALKEIWRVLKSGELRALQVVTPTGFDWDVAKDPRTGGTALQEVVSKVSEDSDEYDKWKAIGKWLMEHGASPTQVAEAEASECAFWKSAFENTSKIVAKRNNRSALTFALDIREKLKANADENPDYDWDDEIAFLSQLIEIFCARSSIHRDCDRASVNASVVERWAAMLQDSTDRSLTIKAADGDCTVHASMLTIASPVVRASLSATMIESSSKTIVVNDCPLAAVNFLMELVYTGGNAEDVTAHTANYALELAHRWQVDDAVGMVESVLIGLLAEDTFEEIASRSHLLNLSELKHACVDFAGRSDAIQRKMKSKSLPEAVMLLLGAPTSNVGHPTKKRRML